MRLFRAITPRQREILLWPLALLLLAASWGCATTELLSTSDGGTSAFLSRPIQSDSIFALGKPDAHLAEAIGHSSAVAFLGERHSYLLFEGGAELLHIARELDGRYVVLLRDDESPQGRLYLIDDRQVRGHLPVGYRIDLQNAEAVRRKLAELGFKQVPGQDNLYRKNVAVEGAVYPPVELTEIQAGRLQTRREVRFFPQPGAKPPPAVGDAAKWALVPFALAFDVASTAVVVVGGLVVLPIVIATQ